jgi:K+-sensing histidine kinase KdpD
LVEFARLNGVSHLFLARPRQSQFPAMFRRTIVQQVVRLARDMQVIIVADRGRSQGA